DFNKVLEFGRNVDVLTFEIEGVNIDALRQLEKEGIKVFPSPQTLEKIQDKSIQKEFYRENKIPTSPFLKYTSKESLLKALTHKEISIPFVWKSSTGGYDGRGVMIVKNEEDLKDIAEGECIAEELVPFKNELAVIVARN